MSHLALTFACGITAGIVIFHQWTSYTQNKSNDRSTRASKAGSLAVTAQELELDREQLTRNYQFFDEAGMADIRKALIVVVGCGGVGSHAAVHLLRSGITKLRLVDFDQVSLSSLNRHATAVRSDVGTPKALAIKNYLLRIFPRAEIDARVVLFSSKNADQVLEGEPTFVLDCIDNTDTKIDLLATCHERNINVISSMGSACKVDPSRIRIADIANSSEDPLARTVRARLRKLNITTGIPVIYSSETSVIKPVELTVAEQGEGDITDFATLPGFRVSILPVLGALPAIFGATMAAFTLCKLAKYPTEPLARGSRKHQCDKMLRELMKKVQRKEGDMVRLTLMDTLFLLDDVWHGKCAISGRSDALTLVVWNSAYPSRADNIVFMTAQMAKIHEALEVSLEEAYGKEKIQLLEERMKLASDRYVLPITS